MDCDSFVLSIKTGELTKELFKLQGENVLFDFNKNAIDHRI